MWFAQVLEFVRKQFRPYSIRWLDGIDAMFGILTPVVCLLIDPRVFTHGPTPSETVSPDGACSPSLLSGVGRWR